MPLFTTGQDPLTFTVFGAIQRIIALSQGGNNVDHDKIVELLQDLGEWVRRMSMLSMSGLAAAEQMRVARSQLQKLYKRCVEANVSVCIFRKMRYPTKENRIFSVKQAMLHNWPSEEGAVHAHITCVYRFTYIGHVEMHAEAIEVELMNPPATGAPSPHSHDEPPPETIVPDEGRVLSDEETKRFLKNIGLGDLDQK